MLTEPPVSEGDLGRQLLLVISPNSATNSTIALIAVDDIAPIMRKQLLVELAKRSSPINHSLRARISYCLYNIFPDFAK
jgi:hypothetical protein